MGVVASVNSVTRTAGNAYMVFCVNAVTGPIESTSAIPERALAGAPPPAGD